MAKVYDSLNEAALAALTEAKDTGGRFETVGLLFRTAEGKYTYSVPDNEQKGKRGSRAKATIKIPEGAVPVALYHNHPKGKRSELFSHEDVKMATQLGIPSYIIGHDGVTRVFDPSRHAVEPRVEGRGFARGGTAQGEVVDLAAQIASMLQQTAAPQADPDLGKQMMTALGLSQREATP
jgi:proteasome lid subunit RPN8/RPN11